MESERVKEALLQQLLSIADESVLNPTKKIITNNISTSVTTFGTFVVRKIADKFVQSISFNTERYYDQWMEDALFGILSKYNNLKRSSHIKFQSSNGVGEININLDPGLHTLKYRKWTIHLNVEIGDKVLVGQQLRINNYTIYCFTTDPMFIKYFEHDMREHYFDFAKANTIPGKVNMFVSKTYGSGKEFSYWEKMPAIPERRINTIYLDIETKKKIVDTVNAFFKNKRIYQEHGIPHNLKIMLYGPSSGGKDSIARMIATEWKRNIYYVKPNRYGEMIPDAICDTEMSAPLIIISDIDNYPDIINHVSVEGDKESDDKSPNTSAFAKMINALDGIISGEDKIILMTTNHIEKFHETFLRPGRIDLLLEIKPVCVYVFRKFIYDKMNYLLPETIELNRDNIKVSELQADILFAKMGIEDICKKYLKEGTY